MPDTAFNAGAMETWTPERILAVLQGNYARLRSLGVQSLGLFGSFLRGTAHSDSDLDFLVVLERPSFADYMAVKFFLEDLFGRQVDLALADSLKPRLREHILSEVLYAEGLSPLP